LTHPVVEGHRQDIDVALSAAHDGFEKIRQSGEAAVAALGSASNTNEALFLLKKYFKDNVDFRIGQETDLYQKMQDDLLRRQDKHPNTRGALDLGMAGNLGGLKGLVERAEKHEIRGMWISFHPQMVGSDHAQTIAQLQRLIAALEFSVISTTHQFEWARKATVQLPMAAWAEEKGTFTNYAGRVQISARAVSPPGESLPLHVMMVEMLKRSNIQVSKDPAAIFAWMAREVGQYRGLDYDTIGPLGALPLTPSTEQTPTQEVAQ
jgi:predicted molibdopterin-dependent oxidoreductase YjgC